MKQPARRGRPRSEKAHQAILAAAIELVREVGYDAVAMDAIAARAGVGKATLYRRWKAKEPLVCEALEQIMRSIPVPDTGGARADLQALMREQRSLYADPATRGLLSGLVAAMARSKRIAAVVRGSFYRARHDAMLAVLRRALGRGELRKDVDLEVALDLFNGPLFYRFLFTGAALDDAFADGVIDALLQGPAPGNMRGRVTGAGRAPCAGGSAERAQGTIFARRIRSSRGKRASSQALPPSKSGCCLPPRMPPPDSSPYPP